VSLSEGGVTSLSNTIAWVEAYLGTKWHLDPSSHLATTHMGRKLGDGALPLCGEQGPNLTQCRLGRGLHLPTKWHIDPSSRLATTDSSEQDSVMEYGLNRSATRSGISTCRHVEIA